MFGHVVAGFSPREGVSRATRRVVVVVPVFSRFHGRHRRSRAAAAAADGIVIVFVALCGDAHAVPWEAERAPAFSDVGLADAVEDEDEEALEGVEDDEEDVEGEVDAVDCREVSDDPS